MLHSGGGGILDGSGGGAKVTPPTKGLGIIVSPVHRYIGEKKHVHPRGKHRLCKRHIDIYPVHHHSFDHRSICLTVFFLGGGGGNYNCVTVSAACTPENTVNLLSLFVGCTYVTLFAYGWLFHLGSGPCSATSAIWREIQKERYSVHTTHVMHTACICTACILHVFCMYSACILHVFCMYSACILHVFCMYSACILHVFCMYSACTPSCAFCMCIACVLRVHCMFCMHCMCSTCILRYTGRALHVLGGLHVFYMHITLYWTCIACAGWTACILHVYYVTRRVYPVC